MNITGIGSALPQSTVSTINREGYTVNDRTTAQPGKNSHLSTVPLDETNETNASHETRAVDPKQLDSAVGKIRDFVQPINDSLQFSLDEDSGRTVVKVIDLKTDEVIRQIPSEEALNIAKALDKLQGLLFQAKA